MKKTKNEKVRFPLKREQKRSKKGAKRSKGKEQRGSKEGAKREQKGAEREQKKEHFAHFFWLSGKHF